MRLFLILACLLFVNAAVAEEADLDFESPASRKALRDYEKVIAKDKKAIELKRKKLDEEAASLAKKNRDAFVDSLKGALKQSMQAGNLDEANKIDAAIKALKKGASPAAGSASGLKGKEKSLSKKARTPLVVGVWKTTAPPGNKNIFIVRPNKTAHHSGDVMEGRWEAANRSGRDFIIHWSNGVVDNIKINRGDKIFNGFSPSSGYRWQMTRDPYPRR